MRSLTILILAMLFAFVANTDDCQAQLFGPRFKQPARPTLAAPPIWVQSAGAVGSYVPQDRNAATVFPIEDYFTPRRPKISWLLDGKMTHKYRDPVEVDARYIGGFHQSHFQNIGIPSGDIGLRGNAYNIRTSP